MTLDEGIRQLAATGRPFTADDLAALCGVADNDHRANGKNSSMGSAFSRASKRGTIQPTGRIVQSTQPHRKAGMIREWIGT